MAWTTEQKRQLGIWLVSIALLTATFSYVGFKVYDNITYKVFQDINGYLELGIENGTKYCSHCEREFYLRLYKYVPFNQTDKSASVIIPNKLYRDMIKIELFDGMNNEKLDIPFIIQYKSGYRWYKYPPSVADLTLTTQRKQFRIIADVPENTAVSGLVGIKVIVNGVEITFSEDPIWFFNGNPINIQLIQDCKTTSERVNRVYNVPEIRYINQTQCSDEPANLSCKIVNYLNQTSSYSVVYIDIINTTICETTGFNISGRIIDFAEIEWKCTRDNSQICCEAPHQSNKDGVCSSGEGYCLFDITTLRKECTVSKTKQIRDLNAKE